MEQFSGAARAGSLAAEMRRVHQRLSDALQIARESIEAGDGTDPLAGLADPLPYCWAFCTALDGHHGGEDSALFPRLREQRPDLADVLDNLTRDHRMIAHLIGDLRRSMAAGAPADGLRRHLDGIDAVMTTHFRYEEKRLLSVLADGATRMDELDSRTVFGPLG